MKIKLSLIFVLAGLLLNSQQSFADDPCENDWADYQVTLADARGNFRDPNMQIAIRALRVCRMANYD